MFNFIWSTVNSTIVPLFFLAMAIACFLAIIIRRRRTEWLVLALVIWFPLETLILKFFSPEVNAVLRFVPEIFLYGLALALYCKHVYLNRGPIIPQELRLPFLAFVSVAIISLVFNWYDITIWILGLRQTVRFVAIFLVIIFAGYSLSVRHQLSLVILGTAIIQAVLGIIQFGVGGKLDRFLFPSQSINVGNLAVLSANDFFWTPGTRIFATMGRYDQLGTILVIGLLVILPIALYRKNSIPVWSGFAALVFALFLTKSRANWLGATAGITALSYYLFQDKRVLKVMGFGATLVSLYVVVFIFSHQNALSITERPNQSVAERLVEAGSFNAWRQSYEGYGRIFFIINTPWVVVADSPLFGVGPGNYGGGVAAALGNTREYDRLHIPFGIQNTYGQIDNSWFSLWGELGTIGLVIVMWIMTVIAKTAQKYYYELPHRLDKNIAATVFGLTIALAVVGFFGPYFEFRTLSLYYWLLVGLLYTAGYQHNLGLNFIYKK